MDVLVPEGVGDKAGYIRIESEGADVEVKGIVMFYKQGVFLKEFTVFRTYIVTVLAENGSRLAGSHLSSGFSCNARSGADLLQTSLTAAVTVFLFLVPYMDMSDLSGQTVTSGHDLLIQDHSSA